MCVEYFGGKCCSQNWLREQQSGASGTHHEPVVHVYLAKTDSHCIDIFLIYPWFEQFDCKSCRNTCAVRIVPVLVKFKTQGTIRPEYRVPHLSDSAQSSSCASNASTVQSAVPLPAQGHCSLQLDFSYNSASQSLPCTKLNSSCCNLGSNLKILHPESPSQKYSGALLGNTSDGSSQCQAGKSYTQAFSRN